MGAVGRAAAAGPSRLGSFQAKRPQRRLQHQILGGEARTTGRGRTGRGCGLERSFPVLGWRTCEGGRLPKFLRAWDGWGMNMRRLLRLAFAVFVTLGLVLAPLASPMAAAHA